MLVGRVKESPYLLLYSQEIEIAAGDFITCNISDGITPAQLRIESMR